LKHRSGRFACSCGSRKGFEKGSQISPQDDCTSPEFAGLKAAGTNCLIELCSAKAGHGACFGYRQAFAAYRLTCFEHSLFSIVGRGYAREQWENAADELFLAGPVCVRFASALVPTLSRSIYGL
jgi:hypothetical protein